MHINKLMKKVKKKRAQKFLTKKKIKRKLGVSEAEFRKLCIFKGIYPKDYKKVPTELRGKYAKSKICYTKGDLVRLTKERKLLEDFRNIKTYLKKYRKYRKRNDDYAVKSIVKRFPKHRLDEIIKERYPIFVNAVEQLDDTLNAIVAYSLLPSVSNLGIKNELVKKCEELKTHFHYYVYKTNKIKKSFISVKGYYIQVQILQKKVTWLLPHVYTPYIPKDIDFAMISDFIEYYIALLKFVLFKLYKLDGMKYPPEEHTVLKEEQFKHLAFDETFISIYKKKAPEKEKNKNKKEPKEEKEKQDQADRQTKEINSITTQETVHNINEIDDDKKELFKNMIFYIHEDMPFEVLSIIILSCGGQICWDHSYSPYKYKNKKITHEIAESEEQIKMQNCEYKRNVIKPQYIFDCLNKTTIIPPEDYFLNKELPPHTSPFIEDDNFKHVVSKEEYAINKMLNDEKGKEEDDAHAIDEMDREGGDISNALEDNEEQNELMMQHHRNTALNNQFEMEHENNKDEITLKKKFLKMDVSNIKTIMHNEEVKRQKLSMSKTKRKLYRRIENREKAQTQMVQKILNKRQTKSNNKKMKDKNKNN